MDNERPQALIEANRERRERREKRELRKRGGGDARGLPALPQDHPHRIGAPMPLTPDDLGNIFIALGLLCLVGEPP